jgi:hypothetical protein
VAVDDVTRDEAVRIARGAMWVTEHFPVDENDMRLPSADHPDFAGMDMATYPSPVAVVDALIAAGWGDLADAAQRVEDYGNSRQVHVSNGGYLSACDRANGDRCDITAAYRHAARLIRGGAQ